MVSAAICLLRSGLRGQYFRVCFWNLEYSCWHYRLHSTKQSKQSIKATRLYQPFSVFTTESYKWKNFCSKQPGLIYYLFIFLYNTSEHNLKLPSKSTSLTALFFSAWKYSVQWSSNFTVFAWGPRRMNADEIVNWLETSSLSKSPEQKNSYFPHVSQLSINIP